jgi:hypothetical protein
MAKAAREEFNAIDFTGAAQARPQPTKGALY